MRGISILSAVILAITCTSVLALSKEEEKKNNRVSRGYMRKANRKKTNIRRLSSGSESVSLSE